MTQHAEARILADTVGPHPQAEPSVRQQIDAASEAVAAADGAHAREAIGNFDLERRGFFQRLVRR
jgi:hypothetical protein